jgi:hypothetical protein
MADPAQMLSHCHRLQHCHRHLIDTYGQPLNCRCQERHIIHGSWHHSTSLRERDITRCVLLPNVIGLEVAISHKYTFIQPSVQSLSQIYLQKGDSMIRAGQDRLSNSLEY